MCIKIETIHQNMMIKMRQKIGANGEVEWWKDENI